MSQSRRMSFLEKAIDVSIGYGIAILTQKIVFPVFGLQAEMKEHLTIAAIFTAISLARGYVIRRAFNWWHYREVQ